MSRRKNDKKQVPQVQTLPELFESSGGKFPFKAYLLLPNGRVAEFNVTGHSSDVAGAWTTDYEYATPNGASLLVINPTDAAQHRYSGTEPTTPEKSTYDKLKVEVQYVNEALRKASDLMKQYGSLLRLSNNLGLSSQQLDLSSMSIEVDDQYFRFEPESRVTFGIGPTTTVIAGEYVSSNGLAAAITALSLQARPTAQVGPYTLTATRSQVIFSNKTEEFYLTWAEADGILETIQNAKKRAKLEESTDEQRQSD